MSDIESYADYREQIEFLADCAEERVDEDPDQDINELVFEEVDGSSLVIYTSQNIDVLQHSDTQPEEWKHFVADGDSWQKVVQAMAFDIVRQDLYEELNDRGVLE